MSLFTVMGRYFWLIGLMVTAFNYVMGVRSLSSKNPADPCVSSEAIELRRWMAIASALPWVVMGWAIARGGVPSVWYFFRPQDRNPYVLGWFASLFVLSLYFAYWVFLHDGAQKIVRLQPVELTWHRATLSGTKSGTVSLTVGHVKLFAAIGPIWMALWTMLVSFMNVPIPK